MHERITSLTSFTFFPLLLLVLLVLLVLLLFSSSSSSFSSSVPAGSPSCSGDVTVYVPDINQPSLPTPLYSVLMSVSVFMALSTVFHSINSPNNSLLSHSVLPVLFLPHWYFQVYISL